MEKWTLQLDPENPILTTPTCARVGCENAVEVPLPREIFDVLDELGGGIFAGVLDLFGSSTPGDVLDGLDGAELELELAAVCRRCAGTRWSKPTPGSVRDAVEDGDRFALHLLSELRGAFQARDVPRIAMLLRRLDGLELPGDEDPDAGAEADDTEEDHEGGEHHG